MQDVIITAKVDREALDEAVRKAERLILLIKEAKSLAGDLTSSVGNLKLNVEL